MTIRFIWKKSCDTCRRYKKALDALDVAYEGREMNAEPLTAHDVDTIIGDRPIKPFLNTRNVVYREQKLAQNPPTREEAIRLIAESNNLLKRPLLIVNEEYVIGNRFEDAKVALGISE